MLTTKGISPATLTSATPAAASLAATELVRQASPFVSAVLLANLAARHPDEARELLEAAEDAQDAIVDVWTETGIAEPGARMWPPVAIAKTPDLITEAREALETARAELSAAMDLPTGDTELQQLREHLETAEDAWHVSLAVHGRFCE